jgi:hypothetical protein
VDYYQLSERACDLVDFDQYWDDIIGLPGKMACSIGPARPCVWDRDVWWLTQRRELLDWWAIPGMAVYLVDVDSDDE